MASKSFQKKDYIHKSNQNNNFVGEQKFKNVNFSVPRPQVIRNWPCVICGIQIKNKFQKFANCKHKLACNTCCQNYLLNCIKQKKKPKCYIEKCPQFLITQNSAYQIFSQTTKDNWQKFKFMLMQKSPASILMIKSCTIPDCQGYLIKKYTKSMIPNIIQQKFQNSQISLNDKNQIEYDRHDGYYLCNRCSAEHCLKCYNLKHINEPCKEQRVQIPQNMKKCPNCKTIIQKTSGCNKVKCTQCTQIFCWNCENKWSQQHMNCQGTISQRFMNVIWGIRQVFQKFCLTDKQVNKNDQINFFLAKKMNND